MWVKKAFRSSLSRQLYSGKLTALRRLLRGAFAGMALTNVRSPPKHEPASREGARSEVSAWRATVRS
jgi:hypothetical protein